MNSILKYLFFLPIHLAILVSAQVFSQHYLYFDYKSFDQRDGYISFSDGGYITQDHKGLIWIGGDNGLYCFDGIHFKNYKHNPSQPNSLPFNLANYNYQDSKGNYWVYVINKGLFRFNIKDGSFIPFTYKNQKQFDINRYQPQLPVEDGKGQLWFPVAGYGIAKWSYKDSTMTPYKICPTESCGDFYSTSWVTHGIIDTTDDSFWFSSNDGLIHFFPADGHYKIFIDSTYRQSHSNVYGNLYLDPQHKVWLCTWSHGIKEFDPVSGQFHEYRWQQTISGTTNISTGIYNCDNKNLWVASYDNGFMLFSIKNKTFTEVRKPETQKGPYVGETLFTDNVIWANNTKHFFRITLFNNSFSYTSLSNNAKHDDHFLSSFLRMNDTLYYGTKYNGHFGTYNLKTGVNRIIHLSANRDESVYTISKDSAGLIWVLTASGIYLYDPKTKHTRQALFTNDTLYKQLKCNDVLHDRDGTHWLATTTGLIHYDPITDATEVFTTKTKGKKQLKEDNIYSLYQDKKGNIWFGGVVEGLACYRRDVDEIVYFDKTKNSGYPEMNCTSITETNDGSILYILEYLGFCVLENPFTNKEKITLYNSANALPSDYMRYMYKDSHGRFWLYTSNGICLFKPDTKQFITFTTDNGLLNNSCESHPYEDASGNMYVGFDSGFQIFNPDSLLNRQPASVFIQLTGLWVNGKEWAINPGLINTLELDHTQSGISFNFAAITPTLQSDFQYAYKLDGLEDHWTFTGQKATGQYTNLSPGKYKLHIKCKSRNGDWYGQEYFLPLIIQPPWYNTWWFYAIIAVAIVTLLYAFYRYRINQVRQFERMRSNISSDLHDDIGSTLTSISYYIELVKMKLNEDDASLKPMLDKIGGSARNTVKAMSDIVWIINPKNDTTENLVNRMKHYAAEMLGTRNIQYTFNTNEAIEKTEIDMQQRKNIYLIYKEAVHNSVKYAQCNNIEINLVQSDHRLSLSVHDDGKGFDILHENDGNGLNNMKRRAEEINAEFEICSAQGKGTHIKLTCKIT